MYATIVGPIVSFIFLAFETIFGIDVPDTAVAETTKLIAEGAALAYVLWGIWKNHKKNPS